MFHNNHFNKEYMHLYNMKFQTYYIIMLLSMIEPIPLLIFLIIACP